MLFLFSFYLENHPLAQPAQIFFLSPSCMNVFQKALSTQINVISLWPLDSTAVVCAFTSAGIIILYFVWICLSLIKIRTQGLILHLDIPWSNLRYILHRAVIQKVFVELNTEKIQKFFTSLLSVLALLLCSAVLWLEIFFPGFWLITAHVNYALQMPSMRRDLQWEMYCHLLCC